MLIRLLLVVAFASALVEALVLGSIAMTQASIVQRASDLASSAVLDASARAQTTLAAAIGANHGTTVVPSSSPAPIRTCLRIGSTACALMATASTTFARVATDPTMAPGASPCACTSYLQANDRVAEGRIGATISVAITNAAGIPISQRDVAVRFRTLATAPYAVLAGSLDLRSDSLAASGVGDDGGAPGADGTLIDVVYQNAATGIQTPANVWQAQSFAAPTTRSKWDP